MKLLKKLTLLSVMLGAFGVNNLLNTVFAGNFDLKLYATINRAVKTGIVDFTIFNTDRLTKQECSRMLTYVNSVKENSLRTISNFLDPEELGKFVGDPLFLFLNKSEVDDDDEDELEDEDFDEEEQYKKFKADNYIKEILANVQEEGMEIIVKYPFIFGKNQYIRRQIMKTIETAYDSGYIDFSQVMNCIELAPITYRCNRSTLYSSLFELGYNLEVGECSDCYPIKIIIDKESKIEDKESEVSYLEKFVTKNFKRVFKITDRKNCKDQYLTLFLKYAKEKNIVDLTAIDLDGMTEEELIEFGNKLTLIIDKEPHVIYYNNSKEYYSKQMSVKLCEAMVAAVPKTSRHGIDLEQKYQIMEQITSANKTGNIVLDEISLPAISKICFNAFKKANGDKEEKLKVKLYADMSKHKELKQILDEDPNIEINYGAFDGGLYEEVQRILTNAIEPNGLGINLIDYSKLPLKDCKTVGLLDLVKACSEHFLLNHFYENRIELEVPYFKKTATEDDKIMEDFRKLKDKYKNLVVIRNIR